MAWDGTHLYAGGQFASAGGVLVQNVAEWDGTAWKSLGTGLDGEVFSLVSDGTNLYAGGYFTTAGGVTAHSVAKWDGTNWSALGTGVGGNVTAMVWDGANLFVGGYFGTAGGLEAHNIAKWDGTNWSALGAGTDQQVYALAWDGARLYAGGVFATAGGTQANSIAAWDGMAWSPMGTGVSCCVYALVWDGSDLYAGGAFVTAGGAPASRIARWDGVGWTTLGAGMTGTVDSLSLDGTHLYAGGSFTAAGGVATHNIAMWDGSVWTALADGVGSSTSPGVMAMLWDGTDLCVGGQFHSASGIAAKNIARWNGAVWMGTPDSGEGIDYAVHALVSDGTHLYAAGGFFTAGGVEAGSIAQWDGTDWKAIGTGTNGEITALAAEGTKLYAGGWFGTIGGGGADNVAQWDGAAWSPLGGGLGATVWALAWDGANLYAGGDSTTSGGVYSNHVSRWDGSAWIPLGASFWSYTGASVYALAWGGENLYAGGHFSMAGDAPANYIAKWDGTAWSTLGTGVDSNVYALAWDGTSLYAGGDFATAGGVAASSIAKWDGTAWSPLGAGIDGAVYALAWHDAYLYAGGNFVAAGGIPVHGVAKWDGTSWSAVGSGVDPFSAVQALAWHGDSLYLGGSFTTAGGVISDNIARWLAPVPSISGPASNACPATSATIATGTYASYQWNLDGQPVAGANGPSITVTQSGSYSVTVTDAAGCVGASAPKAVTVSPCAPRLAYDGSLDPTSTLRQVCGDGDGVVEPGEEWQVTIRLKNTGNEKATNVMASLAADGGSAVSAEVIGAPAAFGTIPSGGTGTATYRFVVDPGATCVRNLTFDVSGIVSSEGSYADQAPAWSVPVGSGTVQNETAFQEVSPLEASDAATETALGPSPTLARADTASLSYAHAYSAPPAAVVLFSDEFFTAPAQGGWTISGTVVASTASPADSCLGGGGSYARLSGTNASMARVVDTIGRAQVTLSLDYRLMTMNSGQGIAVDYSTNGIAGPWTTQWSGQAAYMVQNTNWSDDCRRTVAFPSSCGNDANLAVRIRCTGASYSGVLVDHLQVAAENPVSDWSSSARVELVDPSNTSTVLKGYGETDASPYDVTSLYTGPGAYTLRLSEASGGTATLSSASLALTQTLLECDASSCVGTVGPPPVGNGKSGTTAALFSKDAKDSQQIDVTYDAAHCTGDRAVVLYGAIGSNSGYAGCAQADAGKSGSSSFDASGLNNVWFDLLWADGTTAGHPGYGYDGKADLARTWSAAGECGFSSDDARHTTCP